MALLSSTAIPASLQLLLNATSGQELAQGFFVSAPLNTPRSLFVGAAMCLLAGFSYLSRGLGSHANRHWLAMLPLAASCLIGCHVPSPYGLPFVLSVLAAVVIGLTLVLVTRSPIAGQIERLYAGNVRSGDGVQSGDWAAGWLITLQSFTFGCLVLGTLLVACLLVLGQLSDALNPLATGESGVPTSAGRLSRLMLWAGPLGAALLIRWMIALQLGWLQSRIVPRGYALGIWVGVSAVLLAPLGIETSFIRCLRGFSLAMSAIAAGTLLSSGLRNWIGLRSLDRQSTAWLLAKKACRGARWRQFLTISWRLWLGAMVPAVLISVLAAATVAIYPYRQLTELHLLGSYLSMAAVFAALALWWLIGPQTGLTRFGQLALTLGMIGPMAAAGLADGLMDDPAGTLALSAKYEPYRLQLSVWLAALLIGLIVRLRSVLTGRYVARSVEPAWIALAASVGLQSIASLGGDPYWSAGFLFLLSAITAVSGEAARQSWRGDAAAVVSCLGCWPWFDRTAISSSQLDIVWLPMLAVSAVILLVLVSRYALIRLALDRQDELAWNSLWSIDRIGQVGLSLAAIIASGLWVVASPAQGSLAEWTVKVSIAFGICHFANAALRLVQPMRRGRGLTLYLSTIAATLVLIAVATWFYEVEWIHSVLAWLVGLLGSQTVLAVGLRELSQRRLPAMSWMDAWGLSQPTRLAQALQRMSIGHTIVALVCLLPAAALVLTVADPTLRAAAIALPILGAASIVPLALNSGRWLQRNSVLLLTSATLVFAWWVNLPCAWSVRGDNQSWLFVQRAFLALVALSIVYPLLCKRLSHQNSWYRSLFQAGWVAGLMGAMLGAAMVLAWLSGYWAGFPASVSLATKLATFVGWTGIIARLLQFAAMPFGLERDLPLWLRSTAVYIVEFSLGLLCGSVYGHFPDLFKGPLANWWPLILFVIALVSAGLGELLGRMKQPVLADPVQRSSLFLPLIPLASVWFFQPANALTRWNDWGPLAVLLAVGSGVYALHGWLRNSILLRSLSAVLGLMGFWSLLHSHPDMRFFQHPQFWLLPPALVSIAFVQWNRSRLDSSVVTAVRYVAILVAYFSCTAEVFFRPFEGNLWQPLWLLILALSGVAAGILLRVRAFLFCGLTFVAVALCGMVLHAAQAIDQVWPWWAFGIATGISLIALLGYFEKNRAKILNYLDELKQWQT
jgi:hypothetical protein